MSIREHYGELYRQAGASTEEVEALLAEFDEFVEFVANERKSTVAVALHTEPPFELADHWIWSLAQNLHDMEASDNRLALMWHEREKHEAEGFDFLNWRDGWYKKAQRIVALPTMQALLTGLSKRITG